MANWNDVTTAAPAIAKLAQDRIEATGLGYLATIRKNGFPRVSGVEPSFILGELWLGMMPESLKAKDLHRDARLCLHNANVDKMVAEGDVKITGLGIEVEDLQVKERLRAKVQEETGFDPGTEYHLFRVDVKELATIRPGGDHLVIESWREGEAPKRVERR